MSEYLKNIVISDGENATTYTLEDEELRNENIYNLKSIMISTAVAQSYGNLLANLPSQTCAWCSTAHFTDIPSEVRSNYWIFTYSRTDGAPTSYAMQILIVPAATPLMFLRRISSGAYGEWAKFSLDSRNIEMNNGTLAAETDLNSINYNSIYLLISGNNYTHAPTTAGFLRTTVNGNSDYYIMQEVTKFNTTGTKYFRKCLNGEWSDWYSADDRNVICYCYGDSTTYGQSTSYEERSAFNYPSRLATASGMKVTNKGVRGQGLISDFDEIMQGFGDLSNVNLCTLAWGYNDTNFLRTMQLGTGNETDRSTILSYYNELLSTLTTNFPNCTFMYITGFGIWSDIDPNGFERTYTGGGVSFTYGELCDGIERVCKKYNVHCINQHGDTFLTSANCTSLLNTDRVHPLDEGYRKYSRMLVPKILANFTGKI